MANLFKSLDSISLIKALREFALALRQFFATKSEMDAILPYGLENLCVGAVSAGGQTTLNSDGSITTSGNNDDTYFFVRCTENLIAGQIYTVGFYVTGVPSGNTENWNWPFAGQNNNKLVISIQRNGWCWGTGTIPNDIAAGTNIIFDDAYRGFWNSINISKFVIVKGRQKAYYTPPISNMSVNYAATAGNADYAESAGDAGTLGGYHESAFSKNGHKHTISEITNFPTIGNGRLILKSGDTIISNDFTANKDSDTTINLKESFATRPEINTLGDRMNKVDVSILKLNTAIRIDNPFDDSLESDEDTIESNDKVFENKVGDITLRFYDITSYRNLPVYWINVEKICDVSEVGNSISSLYTIRLTIDLYGTTIASTVGISSDTFRSFYIRGANVNNKICGFDVRGNGTTNIVTAIMSGRYLLLTCQLKLHGENSDMGSYIMTEAQRGRFNATLCLRQTI